MEDIIQEKISADHLLYVSLKYTKTCDVIQNLLIRWGIMIDVSLQQILEKAYEKGKIKEIPTSPMGRIQEARNLFKNNKEFLEIIEDYKMFRKIEKLKKERIGEFRKNVCLKVQYQGKEINIDLEKLKEYAERLEKFISIVKQFLIDKK